MKVFVGLVIVFVISGVLILRSQPESKRESTKVAAADVTSSPADVQEVSDGYENRRFIMRKEVRQDKNLYNFYVANASGDEREVYSTSVGTDTFFRLPFNSWSVEGDYVFFIMQKGDSEQVYVLKSSGEVFEEGRYREVTNNFKQKVKEYRFNQATGWVAGGQLIITTTTPLNTRGPTFWFDVASSTFSQVT